MHATSLQTLRIGGLTLCASTENSVLIFNSLDDSLRVFLDERHTPDFYLRLKTTALPSISKTPPLLVSRSNWELRALPEKRLQWALTFPSSATPLQRVFLTDEFFTEGELIVPVEPGSSVSPFSYLLSEIIVTGLLGRRPGLLTHASAVIFQNRAFLFAGESGAGKSTISALLAKCGDFCALSDERNLLRPMEEKIFCCGTPWPGTSGLFANFSAPLAAVFFLAHGPRHVAHPLAPAEAVERLLINSALPVWSAAGVHNSLDFAARVAENIPCLSLEFTPKDSIADFIRQFADSLSKGTDR